MVELPEESHYGANATKNHANNMPNSTETNLKTSVTNSFGVLRPKWNHETWRWIAEVLGKTRETWSKLMARGIQHVIQKYERKLCTHQCRSYTWDILGYSNMLMIQNTKPS